MLVVWGRHAHQCGLGMVLPAVVRGTARTAVLGEPEGLTGDLTHRG